MKIIKLKRALFYIEGNTIIKPTLNFYENFKRDIFFKNIRIGNAHIGKFYCYTDGRIIKRIELSKYYSHILHFIL